jgi:AcrR family transcriptional regulator
VPRDQADRAETGNGPLPQRRLTRAQAKELTREKLLKSAASVFGSKGFAGASVEEIAEQAGFSIGALYSNFASKEDLFLELMSGRAADRASDTMNLLIDSHEHQDPPWQALGQQMADTADKGAELAPLQAEFWLYAVRHPEAMAAFAARVRQRREPLKLMLTKELARQGIPAPEQVADRAATVVAALFQGMVRQRRIDEDSATAELYADALRWLFIGLRSSYAEAAPTEPGTHNG